MRDLKNTISEDNKYLLNEVENCYKSIGDDIVTIDLNLDGDSDFLYKKTKDIDSDIGTIHVLMDTLGWSKDSKKRFNKMKKYYKSVKGDVGNRIYKMFEKQTPSLEITLEDLFSNLADKLNLIDECKDDQSDWEELDINFRLIKEELDEALLCKEISKFDYMFWIRRLEAAKNYLKKIYI